MPNKPARHEYILVHGAWHGSWCWELIVPRLEALGHRVTAVDLPSVSGEIPYARITLASYVDAVAAAVQACEEKPIVVGHSMAGMVISQLGNNLFEHVAALVYLAAFLPRDGEALIDLAERDTDSLVTQHRIVDEESMTMAMPPDQIRPAFYARCPEELAELAIARLHPEPLGPAAAPVSLDRQRFGRIPRTYIECTEDRALTLPMQRMMYNNTACAQQMTIETDHSPFYSATDELVDCLNRIETSF